MSLKMIRQRLKVHNTAVGRVESLCSVYQMTAKHGAEKSIYDAVQHHRGGDLHFPMLDGSPADFSAIKHISKWEPVQLIVIPSHRRSTRIQLRLLNSISLDMKQEQGRRKRDPLFEFADVR